MIVRFSPLIIGTVRHLYFHDSQVPEEQELRGKLEADS
jgi:hypothetical protein